MIEYRMAQASDVDTLFQIGCRFLKESPTYRDVPITDYKLRGLFQNAVDDPEYTYCNLAIANGEIIGLFLGMIGEYHFSENRIACDIAIYVEPEFRKSKIAVKLVDSFRQWATDAGCCEITIGATTQSHGEGYERLLNRMGFETVGFVTKMKVER